MNDAFRDYVTGVAFNLSLTRNQIAVFNRIAWEIALEKSLGRRARHDETMDGPASPSHFVSAARKLSLMGLVVWTDPTSMKPAWAHYPWEMTKAGEMVWSLLLEAGLVNKPRIRLPEVA